MLGIISDTHENTPLINEAVKIFKSRDPELVIHCGDIISPPTLQCFAGLRMRFVFGNNDGERAGLRKRAQALGFGDIDDELEFELDGKRFYANHGTNPKTIHDKVSSQLYDYVLFGHSHIPSDTRQDRTRSINPGALYMASEYTIAFLDPVSDSLEVVKIPPGTA